MIKDNPFNFFFFLNLGGWNGFMICRGLEQLRDHTLSGWLWFPVARHIFVVFRFCCFQCVHFSALSKVPLHITARRPTPLLPKQCKRENSCKLNHLSAARFVVADGGWILQDPFALFLHFLPVFTLIFSVQIWRGVWNTTLQGAVLRISPKLGLQRVILPFICRVWGALSGLSRIKVLQQLWYLQRTHMQDGEAGLASLLSRGPSGRLD